ncbi:zinc-binding dehydrogenase [Stakelama flava]|uniref:zinc-binding dehydrogenase n=1 Tax=Stakelama flava TaxID=2860338 RepID=UPI001FEB77AE|nr:zinc-binding dehydrogenase [Stakelama flava]
MSTRFSRRSRSFSRARSACGPEIILNMVGASYFAQNLEVLRQRGGIVFIAALGGPEITVPVFALMAKRATLTGSTLHSLSGDETADLAREIETMVWAKVERGAVSPATHAVFRSTRLRWHTPQWRRATTSVKSFSTSRASDGNHLVRFPRHR